MDMSLDDAPDWPPRASASDYADGFRCFSSVGQVWVVRGGQWLRIKRPRLITPDGAPPQPPE